MFVFFHFFLNFVPLRTSTESNRQKRAHAVMSARKHRRMDEKAAADAAVVGRRMEEHTAEYRRHLAAKRASGRRFGITMREPTAEALSKGWRDHEGPKLALVVKGLFFFFFLHGCCVFVVTNDND